MDGILSQDEINALLGNLGEDLPEPDAVGAGGGEAPLLTEIEKDAIGEIANISMGSSATTLYSLVNRKVSITTPKVDVADWSNLMDEYERPCVFIQIRYTHGLDGTNILVLKENDVKIITDLMMGGDGTGVDGELGDLHLSAISEAMNQMMGSSSTSLSTMLGTLIDISPPEATLLNLTEYKSGEEVASFLGGPFVKISFRMQIDTLVDSTIMQLYPVDFARELVDSFMNMQLGVTAAQPAPPVGTRPEGDRNGMEMNNQTDLNMQTAGMQAASMQAPNMQTANLQTAGMQAVNIAPAQFQSFGGGHAPASGGENIGLIMDVPLEVTVELGRTTKSISDILSFAPGTIIELDRIAGEPIDVLVNGKFVAKGEVVVIEESFGIRVTEIIK